MKTNRYSETLLERVPFAEAGNAFPDVSAGHDKPATEKHWQAAVYHDYSALKTAWQQLEKSGYCTIFQVYDYVASLYDAASSTGAAEPLVVVVSQKNGGIAWILPLCMHRRGKLRIISFADLGLADYAAPLIAPNAPSDRDSVMAMLKTAFAALPPCDIINFQKLTGDVQGIQNPLLFLQGLEQFPVKCHGIRITEPWPTLARKIMQPNLYRTIKRERKRLEKAGIIEIGHYDTPETIEPELKTLFTMRQERFKSKGLGTIPPVWESFYRTMTVRKDRRLYTSITTITVSGKPIAMCLGLTQGKTYYALVPTFKMGEWERYRPGMQLFDFMLTKFAERAGNDGYFDFTTGDEVYKGRMGADTRVLYDWMAPRSLKGVSYYLAWRIKSHCRQYPRIFALLKRMWQRRTSDKT